MFARLTGTVDTIYETSVILDVQGVGYLVTCSGRTLARLDGPGTPARLHIETQVREDAISLFGFIDVEEQQWFKLLTTVQGVGARVGMNILSVCSPHEIHMAIAARMPTGSLRAGERNQRAGACSRPSKAREGDVSC